MPAKNTIKAYTEHGHYHIYNRGVDKRDIFLDDHDYQTFLSLLKTYLSPPIKTDPLPRSPFKSERPYRIKRRNDMNLQGEIQLLAYCLMPNHFHLLIRQNTSHGIVKLMRRVCTSYATYFNTKYERSGTLFEGVYKAILITEEPYFLHLSRYIHLNPVKTTKLGLLSTSQSPVNYPYSSYHWYLEPNPPPWLNTSLILAYFQKNTTKLPNHYTSYSGFVEDYKLNFESFVENLTLE